MKIRYFKWEDDGDVEIWGLNPDGLEKLMYTNNDAFGDNKRYDHMFDWHNPTDYDDTTILKFMTIESESDSWTEISKEEAFLESI